LGHKIDYVHVILSLLDDIKIEGTKLCWLFATAGPLLIGNQKKLTKCTFCVPIWCRTCSNES